MQEIVKEDKYLIISNGRELIVHIHNTNNTVTSSGQPFMLLDDTLSGVCDLFYSDWTPLTGEEYDVDSEEVSGVPYNIDWHIGKESEEDVQQICDLVMSISENVKIQPIKHPDREEWATPYQEKIFSTLPDGEVKNILIQELQASEPNRRTTDEMKSDGWF